MSNSTFTDKDNTTNQDNPPLKKQQNSERLEKSTHFIILECTQLFSEWPLEW